MEVTSNTIRMENIHTNSMNLRTRIKNQLRGAQLVLKD